MSHGIGESIRRRQRKRPGGERRPARRKIDIGSILPRWPWIVVGLLCLPLGFGLGYYLTLRLVFPAPVVVDAGVFVPELVGLQIDEVEEQLAALDLQVDGVSQLSHPSVPVGTVIAQTPLAGQQLRPGLGVRLAVSSGRPRGFVPDLVGFSVERAEALARRIGFETASRLEVSRAPAGQVLRIEPPAGTQVELPARLNLVVSIGPPPDTLGPDTVFGPGREIVDTLASAQLPTRGGFARRQQRAGRGFVSRHAPNF